MCKEGGRGVREGEGEVVGEWSHGEGEGGGGCMGVK